MNIIKKYIDYLKDNPEGYWFKRKLFGWGWTPATWQGWFVTAFAVAYIITKAFSIDENAGGEKVFSKLLIPVFLVIIFLVVIAYSRGEKPKWQFGFPQKKEEENKEVE